MYKTTLPFFNAYGRLHTGLKRLELCAPFSQEVSQNPGLLPLRKKEDKSEWQEDDPVWKASRILDELDRFQESKVDTISGVGTNKAFGSIPDVAWLDKIARESCEQALKSDQRDFLYTGENTPSYLIVELPAYDVPVMHEETFYPVPQQGASGSVTPLDLSLYKKNAASNVAAPFHPLQMVPFLDYENENDNPVEDKYRTLAHDLLRGLVDPALKPDRVQRDRLAAIIASPSHHPTREDKGKKQ
jgi:hypothetical protein